MFSENTYEFIDGFPKCFFNIRYKKFNDWEIAPWKLMVNNKKLIGEGEFGKVYMADWANTQVVAKVVNDNISEEKKRNFIKEINLHTILVHPNIVQFLGYVSDPFIMVMEYVPNGELLNYINNKSFMSNWKKIEICKNILKAIEYMHDRHPYPVIHRDLKPQNIMMTPSGFPKLADFGISRLVGINRIDSNEDYDDMNLITIGKKVDSFESFNCSDHLLDNEKDLTNFCGSKRYMSPEMSKNSNYSLETDIWSLGVIFSELFENERYIPNNGFLYRKTPKIIKNIIISKMLVNNPTKRLSASKLITLFDESQKSFNCFRLFSFKT